MINGLSAEIAEKIIEIISENKEIDEIILFGSRAKKTHKNSSDIDLALRGDFSQDLLLEISNQLDELYLPYKIDLVHLSQDADQALVDHVNRAGISLYKK